jgi:hypothetical protein
MSAYLERIRAEQTRVADMLASQPPSTSVYEFLVGWKRGLDECIASYERMTARCHREEHMIDLFPGVRIYTCSSCQGSASDRFRFCPNCGAEADG